MLLGGERGRRNDKALSTHREAKIKSTLKPNQMIIPAGVIIIFSLFLVVATRYRKSAYLSAKFIVLLVQLDLGAQRRTAQAKSSRRQGLSQLQEGAR